jgi:hypothetical protein
VAVENGTANKILYAQYKVDQSIKSQWNLNIEFLSKKESAADNEQVREAVKLSAN